MRQSSIIILMCRFTLGLSIPIFIHDAQYLGRESIVLPRASTPAPPAPHAFIPASSPAHSSNNGNTPPGTSASLPITPPNSSKDLPATPQGHKYEFIHVTPSDSGSPYKPRRVKGQVTNVKAGDLKSQDYRTIALAKEKLVNSGFNAEGYDADHILEPQTVAFYVNQHRKAKISVGCHRAIEEHLNHEPNLQMLNKGHNNRKMAVVSGLLQAKDPKSLRLVRPFSTVVANHVLRNRVQILETANKVDKLFAANGACKEVSGGNRHGIRRAAKKMIRHAENSKSHHRIKAARKTTPSP